MAKRSVQRSRVVLDPMFFIPDGVDEFEYSDAIVPMDEGLDIVETPSEELGYEVVGDDEGDFEDYSDIPETPVILGVILQTLRRTADGTQVVDLVIEVEDIPGISKYEIHITKAQDGQVIT